jgi:hypothetical protein
MGEQAVQSLSDGAAGLVFSVFSVLLMPTIVLLVLKRYVPILGNPLWRMYTRLLSWLVVAPVRLVRVLFREAIGRRRR